MTSVIKTETDGTEFTISLRVTDIERWSDNVIEKAGELMGLALKRERNARLCLAGGHDWLRRLDGRICLNCLQFVSDS